MNPPGTFERVYLAIKERLRVGRYRPGARLEPALLSDELNASVTPVRDALHRLTGERLVEAPRQEGFRAPMMTEIMLRQLYGWHHDLLLLALMRQRASAFDLSTERPSEVPSYERVNLLFLAIAKSTGNPEHVMALRSLTERLEPVQRIEQLLIEGTERETGEILAALRSADRKAIRRSLVRYHRRRERIVPDVLTELMGAE